MFNNLISLYGMPKYPPLIIVTVGKIQVYYFLLYFSHKQPNGYFVAKTCICHFSFLQ